MRFLWANYTDKGVKAQNEDAVGGIVPEHWAQKIKGGAFVISDGVSSAEAGKEASYLCVNEFLKEYYKTPDLWPVKTSAHRTLTMLNRQLFSRNREFKDAERGFVATLSCLIIKARQLSIFHIGDSRIYRIRGNQLEQLTKDHHRAVADNPHCLDRAMGVDIGLAIDFKQLELESGDRFLMTTDGVHEYIPEERLLEIVNGIETSRIEENSDQAIERNQTIEKVCRDLIAEALANDSDDNLSCQIVVVDDITEEDEHYFEEKELSLPFPPPLESGMVLDGYCILETIHASSRSQVYRVLDQETQREMVMKTPSLNFVDDKDYIDRFILEAWVGSRIEHKNVVKIEPFKRKQQFLYYLMEKLDGITLEQWMERNPPPTGGEMIKIVKQIIDGIQAFHDREVIHRDIKPGNIVITEEGVVKIVDFGSVYVPSVAEIEGDIRYDELLGTVNYTDPEYRVGHKPGVRGDMFSIATLVYEMLSREFPYGNKLARCDTPQAFKKLRYTNSFKFNKKIPIWFDGALRKAVEINPSKRYHSLKEFYYDLTHPNPYFLSEEYLRDLEASLPAVPVWQMVSLLWIGSLVIGILVFVL